MLGAWVRHYGALAAVTAHGLIALAVLAGAIAMAVRTQRYKQDVPALVTPSLMLAALAVLQVVLGVVALLFILPLGGLPRPVGFYEAVLRTGHQTNAALVAGFQRGTRPSRVSSFAVRIRESGRIQPSPTFNRPR